MELNAIAIALIAIAGLVTAIVGAIMTAVTHEATAELGGIALFILGAITAWSATRAIISP